MICSKLMTTARTVLQHDIQHLKGLLATVEGEPTIDNQIHLQSLQELLAVEEQQRTKVVGSFWSVAFVKGEHQSTWRITNYST